MSEQRPPSTFYADINDPFFPPGYFDQEQAIIEDYVAQYKQVIKYGHDDPASLEPRQEAAYWQYTRSDFILKEIQGDTHVWRVIDRGGGFYRELAWQGDLETGSKNYFAGSGPRADERLDNAIKKSKLATPLLNSDGILLNSAVNGEPYLQDNTNLIAKDHMVKRLFLNGLARVYQHELFFTGYKPRVQTARAHDQFGIRTQRGFVPLLTILSHEHPVMKRIMTEAHNEYLERTAPDTDPRRAMPSQPDPTEDQ